MLLNIACGVRDLALSLELATDLPVKGLLVGFDGQQEVGSPGPIKGPSQTAFCPVPDWVFLKAYRS